MSKIGKTRLASLFFLIVAIADIYAIITHNKEVEMIAKPLIATSLVILYLVSVKQPNFWYVSALFFAFWGDVLLLFQDQFFIYGLASFLLAHVLLITISSKFLNQVSIPKILLHSFPFVALLGGLIYMIYSGLGEMLIPVIVYGIVISIFGVITSVIYASKRSVENGWLFLGALTFIASDSILAINKFYHSTELLGISIMITYIIAQYLICRAMILKTA